MSCSVLIASAAFVAEVPSAHLWRAASFVQGPLIVGYKVEMEAKVKCSMFVIVRLTDTRLPNPHSSFRILIQFTDPQQPHSIH